MSAWFARLIAALIVAMAPTLNASSQAVLRLLTDEIRGGRVAGLSADGEVLVGTYTTPEGKHGYIWTERAGLIDLDPPGARHRLDQPSVTNLDGTVVSGLGVVADPTHGDLYRAMRWEQGSGTTVVGNLCGAHEMFRRCSSATRGMTPDGAVMVGVSDFPTGTYVFGVVYKELGFVWTEDRGMRVPVVPDGFSHSSAHGVSADGTVVIGSVFNEKQPRHAVRWRRGGVIELLAPDAHHSTAWQVSSDGERVLGKIGDDKSEHVVLWTTDGTVQLPDLGKHRPTSGMMTSDGTVVAGTTSCIRNSQSDEIVTAVIGPMTNTCPWKFFVWDNTHGTRDLAALLAEAYGFELHAGWRLLFINSMSADSTVLAGFGVRTDESEAGFLLRLPRRLDAT